MTYNQLLLALLGVFCGLVTLAMCAGVWVLHRRYPKGPQSRYKWLVVGGWLLVVGLMSAIVAWLTSMAQ